MVDIYGSITALITPLKNGKLDETSFERIIERQINEGTHGLVPAGTTGESPALDHDEHNRVTELCVEIANKRIPVIAGTGSNATHEAVSLTQHAEKVGADAALVVVPYYNKPSPEGLYQHLKTIHDETTIPIILYNVPGRTVISMSNETSAKLAELPRIIGIKDATGDLSRPLSLYGKLHHMEKDFLQLSGEDDTVLEFMEYGGKGCISVTSNIAPKLCAQMHEAWRNNDKETARGMQRKLMPLHEVMFCESSPAPAKYAAHLLGLCSEEMRLPLVPPQAENKQRIEHILKTLELL